MAIIESSKISVVVIEDHHEIRTGLQFIINNHSRFSCFVFSNAEAAVDFINSSNTDIILMDINLPGMDGIECTARIKEKYPHIQVMMCTVYDDDDRIFQAIAAGANGYILKKHAADQLISSLLDINEGGSPMSSSIARKVLQYFQDINVVTPKEDLLSKRENEILDLLALGKRNKEIASDLYLSPNTIRTHIYNIYEKLHVQNRIEALNKTGRANSNKH